LCEKWGVNSKRGLKKEGEVLDASGASERQGGKVPANLEKGPSQTAVAERKKK